MNFRKKILLILAVFLSFCCCSTNYLEASDGLFAGIPDAIVCCSVNFSGCFEALFKESFDGNAPVQKIVDFFRLSEMIPESLYFYFAPPENFVFHIGTKVKQKTFIEMFREENIIKRKNGFSIIDSNLKDKNNPTVIFVGSDSITLFPANLEEIVLSGISEKKCQLPEKMETFRKMASRKPFFAMEADLNALIKILSDDIMKNSELSKPWSDISLVRVIIEKNYSKAQFLVRNQDLLSEKNSLGKNIIDFFQKDMNIFDGLTNDFRENFFRKINISTQGNSLYFDGEGLGDMLLESEKRFLIFIAGNVSEIMASKLSSQ
ncbi:MAG: hypothetical protein HQM10_02900 [Candidatus Riflebacteria bacterium]|nr:hypothetical protein [Candidatus Riflebacteria bacterium]